MKLTTVRSGAVLLAVLLFASPAFAGWGHFRGGSSGGGGSSGSLGSSGVYAGGSSGYGSSGMASSGGSSGSVVASSGGSSGAAVASSGGSSGRVTLRERMANHMAAKRARRAANASSGGSSGTVVASSGGSSGGSSGTTVVRRRSYGSSGGSGGSSGSISYARASHGGSSGTVRYAPAPVSYGSTGASYGSVGSSVYYGASNSSSNSTPTIASLASTVKADAVHLTVAVPSDTKIYVNGKLTASKGTVRQFVSRGLQPQKEYKFNVRAELLAADGEVMVEEKTLVVSGGQREDLKFAFEQYDNSVETALTLNVPEGAEVRLAGNPTKATGPQRVYRTSRLKAGQVWDSYEVEVQLGDQVKRKTVRLLGGDRLELSFNFTEDAGMKLAAK